MKAIYLARPLRALLPLLALVTAAQAQTTNFAYTGASQTYTVPAGIMAVQVAAIGASGGIYTGGNGSTAALGSLVLATVDVTPGEVLTVQVGGQGGSGDGYVVVGGYNGGGAGRYAGAGGGASDVRRASANGSTSDYLTTRNSLLVAGGGGGSYDTPATGGGGGTPAGGNGSPYNASFASAVGGGASQTAPGSGGSHNGAVGTPGSNDTGGTGDASSGGSGGGGGYYGGGGSTSGAGGGGGSSWVLPTARYTSYGMAPAVGNGVVSITPLCTSGAPATNLQATAITATTATFTFSSGVVVCAAPRISYTYAGGSPVSVPYAMPVLLTGLPPATAITVTVVRRVPASLNQGAPCCESPAATLTFTTAAPLAVAALAGATTLALAPNPTCTSATLTLAAPLPAPALAQVFDGLGRAVRQLPLPARATTAVLDLAGLAPGLYLVRVGQATARLVLE